MCLFVLMCVCQSINQSIKYYIFGRVSDIYTIFNLLLVLQVAKNHNLIIHVEILMAHPSMADSDSVLEGILMVIYPPTLLAGPPLK